MNPLEILLFVVVVAWAVGGLIWTFRRSASLVDRWAGENGYDLIDSSYAWFPPPGRFLLTTTRGQAIYRVTVRDAGGNTRRGWVRCGSWWAGLFSDRVEVLWDG